MNRCINCGALDTTEFLNLGLQPNGNRFPTETEAAVEPVFPLSMNVCEQCWQVQLAEFPSPEFLFMDHPYVTGLNVPIVEHFERLVPHVVRKLSLPANSLVLDIGCNDGTLLEIFSRHGMRTIGVDPNVRTGTIARDRGITVAQRFWGGKSAEAMATLGLRPNLITATAVFYHVPDLHDFIEGCRQVMGKDAVLLVQGVSLKELIERNEFDHFYHEHSCIHAVGPLQRLFDEHDMRILDIEPSNVHGGSFLLYAVLKSHPTVTSAAVAAAVQAERDAGLQELVTYRDFAERVRKNCEALKELLVSLQQAGERIAALGAPVKGSTLLNFAEIGNDLVEYALEVNPFKIGRLMPGVHVPVVDEDSVAEPPDYYLVLAWNFLEHFARKHRVFLQRGGRFIVPVPTVRVMDAQALGISG